LTQNKFILSPEHISRFIAQTPGKVGKREIVRAFKLGPAERILLKRMLKEMEAEGALDKEPSGFTPKGTLPDVVVADITSHNRSKGEWTAKPANWKGEGVAPVIFIRTGKSNNRGPAPKLGDQVLVRVKQAGSGYSGRIIKLLSKETSQVLGILRLRPGGIREVEPVDKRLAGRTMVIAPGDEGGADDGDLVAVDVLKDARARSPRARVRERIGSMGNEKSLSMISLHAHAIAHVFDVDTLREAEEAKPALLKGREDWRELPLVTIDPLDAKDHDDAVHAEPDINPDNEGGHIITVAIADVAYYVRPHTALDRTALERGNSVYFPGRVVPMLPERISNDLCSLRPNENRPAIAVRLTVDAKGRVIAKAFHRILMRSAAKLSYEQAQSAIDGTPDDTTGPLLEPVLKPLWAAYEVIRRAREKRAPLELDLPERKIILNEDGSVNRVMIPPRLDAHRLIEECMILANVAAAETLQAKTTPLIFRVHESPSMEKLTGLRTFLMSLDLAFAKSDAVAADNFNRLLTQVKNTEHKHVINEVVLRTQSQAEYASKNKGHFGLTLGHYAHFTSPIRRYADLIVHRGLITAHGWGEDGLADGTTPDILSEISTSISQAERRAMAAERETTDRLIAHHLANQVGADFSARISGVTRIGLFVTLHDTGASGFIPAATIGRDYYEFDENNHALIGERTGEAFRLGDNLDVRLVEAAPAAGALRFQILGEGRLAKDFRKRTNSRKAGKKFDKKRDRK
jgi:ribonuclease R